MERAAGRRRPGAEDDQLERFFITERIRRSGKLREEKNHWAKNEIGKPASPSEGRGQPSQGWNN